MNRRARDYPSARYGSTPVDGPFQGIGIKPHWEAMLYNYYRVLGWDVATGKPLPQTLQAVGLGHVIADLWCTRAHQRVVCASRGQSLRALDPSLLCDIWRTHSSGGTEH